MCIAALCLSQTAWASTAEQIANYIATRTGGGLTAEVSGDTVIVTGNVSVESTSSSDYYYLTLNIDASVTIVWQAILETTPRDYSVIYLHGGSGTFSMQSGSITSITSIGGTIDNYSTGTVNISGGTISSIANNSTGTVNISGGTIGSIYNNDTGIINISGGTISSKSSTAILANDNSRGTINISGGTISSESGRAIYVTYGSTVNISGGTVSSKSGSAIFSAGNIIVSDSAKITSANPNSLGGTIYLRNVHHINTEEVLIITGGIIENTAENGGRAIYSDYGGSITISGGMVVNAASLPTIYSNFTNTVTISDGIVENTAGGAAISSMGPINISGGMVNATSGCAICSSSNITVSGGIVSTTSGNAIGNYSYSGSVTVLGGTVSATSGNAINSNCELILGANPTITGRIYVYPENLGVITDGTDKFAPESKMYTLDFLKSEYKSANIAVMNGKDFLNNFEFYNPNWILSTEDTSDNIVIIPASKVWFRIDALESFENSDGLDFDGWYFVNGSYKNKWIIGTAASNTGSYSAYISNDGSTNSYNNASSHVHVCKEITFPELDLDLTLSFYFKGSGETDKDYMYVAAGPILSDGTVTGIPFETKYRGSNWSQKTVTLPSADFSGKNMMLFFSWINNDDKNYQPPAAIDDIDIGFMLPAGRDGKFKSLPKPIKEGYIFEGWFTKETGGTLITKNTEFNTDAIVHARWTPGTPTTYTVTFNANGGSVTPASAITNANGVIKPLPTPARGGYAFNGWFTAATGGTEVTISTEFSENATIYAQWTPAIYTVTFNANGGSVTPESALTGNIGTLASLPTPARDGYIFNGWFTEEIGGTKVTISTVFNSNAIVYAQWTPIYIVTFNANGGKLDTLPTESFENGINDWVSVNGSQSNKWIVGTAASNTGSYSAYVSNNGSANSYSSSGSPSIVHMYKDITFPASASGSILSFYFKGNGETDYDYMTVRYSGTNYTPIAGSIFDNGTQLGTNYNSNSGWSQKTHALPVATFSSKAMRLVFSWINDEVDDYPPPAAIDDIRIIINQLTGATEENRMLASLPTPAREGYIFEGWFTAETGGTEVTISTVFSENTTVYARWTGTTPVFSNKENSTIQRIGIYAIDNTIMLKNLPLNAKIEIYNLRGERIYSTTSRFPLATSLTIPVLTKGMYVVKVANQVMRIVVK